MKVFISLDVMATDMCNDFYLLGVTKEKVYTVARPELSKLSAVGRKLMIHKAFYGLKASVVRWHKDLSHTLRTLSFRPSKMDSNL